MSTTNAARLSLPLFLIAALISFASPGLAQGDFNDDGRDELVVGVPFEDLGTGMDTGLVHIFRTNDFLGVAGETAALFTGGNGVRFGFASATGHFDDDRFEDLAVGLPGAAGGGEVMVFYGSANGLISSQFDRLRASDYSGSGVSLDGFGESLIAADFNGDSFEDLAIGAPASTVNSVYRAGALVVVLADSSGLDANNPSQVWHQDSPGVDDAAEKYDGFGFSLEANTFDPDGFADLAVGVPQEDIGPVKDAGMVMVFRGNSGGLGTDPIVLEQGLNDPADHYTMFGYALASGMMSSDGLADLAVGAPGMDVKGIDRAGQVRVFFGDGSGLTTLGAQRWHQDFDARIPDNAEPFDMFGSALAVADFDGNGLDDLAIGVPNESLSFSIYDYHGAVHVLYSGPVGPSAVGNQFWHQDSSGIQGTAERSDRFGAALTSGNFNDVGGADLIVGVPSEAIGSVTEAGGFNAIYSFGGVLSSSYDRFWSQNSSTVSSSAESRDYMARSFGK